ncbi:MAG: thymidylate synthase [Candidatus Saccharimonadales bacterium]
MNLTPMTVSRYGDYYTYLLSAGMPSSPRGVETVALQNVSVTFRGRRVPRRPKDNPAIGIIEGLQLIAGIFDLPSLQAAAPRARLDLFGAQSAYGPRVAEQIPLVIDVLITDPATRQAVLVFDRGNEPPAARPCTTSIQFQVDPSGVNLNMAVSMRSSDAVWGLPYDLVQFNLLLEAVAYCTNFVPGNITFHLGNAHIYTATKVQAAAWGSDDILVTRPIISHGPIWHDQVAGARELIQKRMSARELMDQFLDGASND